MRPVLALYDLEKRFGERIALRIDCLELASSRLHLLTGPNGSGKSTLLQILGFLEAPSCGEVWLDGQKASFCGDGSHQARQQVTLLHQHPYLITGSVADNVGYGLRLRGIRGKELHQRVAQALDLLRLNEFGGRDARRLSGGESRRVALARVLASNPRVLLLDEPLANLDQENGRLLEHVIAELPKQGTTVVMSSHESGQAERLGALIIRLEQGRLLEPRQIRPEQVEYDWRRVVVCPALAAHGS